MGFTNLELYLSGMTRIFEILPDIFCPMWKNLCTHAIYSESSYPVIYSAQNSAIIQKCVPAGYIEKQGKEWQKEFWNYGSFILRIRKSRAEKFKIINIFLIFRSGFPCCWEDKRAAISKTFLLFFTLFLYISWYDRVITQLITEKTANSPKIALFSWL